MLKHLLLQKSEVKTNMSKKEIDKKTENKDKKEKKQKIKAKKVAIKKPKKKRKIFDFSGVRNVQTKFAQFSRFLSNKFEQLFSRNKFTVAATFLLAMLLVYSVNSLGSISLVRQVSDTVRDKEVIIEYDREKFIVEDVPSVVDVVLYGDDAAIQSTKNTGSYSVLVDLNSLSAGEHVVDIKVVNLPANVQAYAIPSIAKVRIYTREFKNFMITAEIINGNAISGTNIANPVLTENQVTLKGASKDLDRVAFVRALIDGKTIDAALSDRDATRFENGRAIVVAYDEQGNRVENVSIDTGGIGYSVDLIKATGKAINTIVPNIVGNFPEGMAIKTVELGTEAVTINGLDGELEKISELIVNYDLKTINEDGSIDGDVIIPNGVNVSVSPQKISAKITFDVAQEKVMQIAGVFPINIDEERYTYEVMSEEAPMTVTVIGTEEMLARYEQNEQVNPLRIEVDMNGLGEGVQQVNLIVNGSTYYRYELSQTNIRIRVARK